MDEIYSIEPDAKITANTVNHDGAVAPIHFDQSHYPSPTDDKKGIPASFQ
jgi:hypothetical protein